MHVTFDACDSRLCSVACQLSCRTFLYVFVRLCTIPSLGSRHYTDYNKLAADGRALYGRLVRGFERPKPPAPLVLPPVDPTDPNVPKPPYFTT